MIHHLIILLVLLVAGVMCFILNSIIALTRFYSFQFSFFWHRCPSWSDDEVICARNVNNEIHFFENNNFSMKRLTK